MEWNSIDEMRMYRVHADRGHTFTSMAFISNCVHGRVYERTYLRRVYAIIEYRDFDARPRKMMMKMEVYDSEDCEYSSRRKR